MNSVSKYPEQIFVHDITSKKSLDSIQIQLELNNRKILELLSQNINHIDDDIHVLYQKYFKIILN